MRPPTRAAGLAASVVVAIGFIALWQWLADARLISPVFLPGPDRAWAAVEAGFHSGVLLGNTLATIRRMILGWLLASLLGVALGVVIGSSSRAREILEPTFEFLRPLPASAVVPIAIMLLGLSESMVLAVIAFGAVWPMLLATVHGFSAVEPRLYEVARVLGLSRWAVVRKVALPNSLPDILAGMRLGITVALILAVVGEMLASREGLGSWILMAGRSFRSADLFAGVIILGAIGYVSSALLRLVEARLLRWRNIA